MVINKMEDLREFSVTHSRLKIDFCLSFKKDYQKLEK